MDGKKPSHGDRDCLVDAAIGVGEAIFAFANPLMSINSNGPHRLDGLVRRIVALKLKGGLVEAE